MKYFVVTGETSGDAHGANLMREILGLDKEASFEYWGGDQMQQVYGNPLTHIRELAIMGFVEVVKNLPRIFKNLSTVKSQIMAFQPDVLILIDYPGFNLRLCKWAKKNNIKVCYYISPKVWAWRSGRADIIRKYVDKCLVILPFEKDWFADRNIDVTYVGNPIFDEIEKFKSSESFYDYKSSVRQKIMGLIPGSRKQEILKILPEILSAFKNYESQFVGLIPVAPSIPLSLYQKIIDETGVTNIKLLDDKFYSILASSDIAIVGSGTATLETALFNVPQVVVYKTGTVNYHIAKSVIKTKYISLVNLICDAPIVVELIQHDLNQTNLTKNIDHLIGLSSQDKKEFYKILTNKMGVPGASLKAAQEILTLVKKIN